MICTNLSYGLACMFYLKLCTTCYPKLTIRNNKLPAQKCANRFFNKKYFGCHIFNRLRKNSCNAFTNRPYMWSLQILFLLFIIVIYSFFFFFLHYSDHVSNEWRKMKNKDKSNIGACKTKQKTNQREIKFRNVA